MDNLNESLSYNKTTSSKGKKSRIKHIVKWTVFSIILLAIASFFLWYFVINNFRAGKIDNIQLGSDKARVERVLGEPDAESDFTWEYYSNNYLQIYQKIEDKTVDLFNAVETNEIEKLTEELAELTEEAFNMEYKYICITFDVDDRVQEVIYDANRCDGELLSKKWNQPLEDSNDSFWVRFKAKLKTILHKERIEIIDPIPAFYNISENRLNVQIYYADGSYKCYKLSAETLSDINTSNAGSYTISWQDEWGEYSTTVTVSDEIKKGTVISGHFENTVQYTLTALDDGTFSELPPFSLKLEGEGMVESETQPFIWEKYGLEKAITTLSIGENITGIEKNAFSSFSSLKEIDLRSSNFLLENNVLYTADRTRVITASSAIESYSMPDSVTEIDAFAFSSANAMHTVTIGGGISILSEYAFSNCSALKNVEIPKSLERIEFGVFKGCSSLESITLPFVGAAMNDTINTHFGYIFGANDYSKNGNYVPDSLHTVIIAGENNIDNYAFNGCTSLISITLPQSIKSIGEKAFSGCYKLIEVYNLSTLPITTGSTEYGYVGYYARDIYTDLETPSKLVKTEDKYIYYLDTDVTYLIGYIGKETAVALPDSYNGQPYSINDYAFVNCSSLKTITIPDSVQAIGWSAFEDCSNLTGVYIGDIAAWCAIDFGNSYANPLFYAHNLYLNGVLVTELKIPDSVTSIGSNAFLECSSLTSITFGENSQLTSISWSAFEDCSNLTKVTLEEKSQLTTIGSSAFSRCSSLMSITIPDSVTSIGSYVFEDCSSLTNVTYGENSRLISIGSFAFEDCSNLASITIPDSVTCIEARAFAYCSNLMSVTFGKNCQLTNIGDRAFEGCSNLASIIIPDSIISIENYVFVGCNSLTSITLPDSVTSIGDGAFSECSSLTSITLPNNVTSIGEWAFYKCSSLTTITIPDSVTSIGERALYKCSSLKSINLPNSVTTIGDEAFSECSSLTIYCEVASKPNGWNSSWNSSCPIVWDYKNNDVATDGYIYVVIDNIRCTLKEGKAIVARQPESLSGDIVIPISVEYKGVVYSVTSIGSYAFYNCNSLTSITIPDSVTSMGDKVFTFCSSLTIYCEAASKPSGWHSSWNYSDCPVVWDCNNNEIAADGYIYVVIDNVRYALKDGKATVVEQSQSLSGDIVITISVEYKGVVYSVTSIRDGAFSNCSSLTSITIPDSVTSIGDWAFYNCNRLMSIIIPDKVTSIGEWAFSECSRLTSIIIPESVTSIEDKAFYNCRRLTIYCEAESKPSGWDSSWNDSDRPVIWGS